MNELALYLGYCVVALGAVAALLLAVLGCYALWWKVIRSKYAFDCIREALREWKARHPEKAQHWQNVNDRML